MTPFNPDLNAFIMSAMPDGNSAALQAKTMSDRDESPAEFAARAIRIEAVEQKLMESADFVAEAIGESREDIFKDIGTYAGLHEDNLVGVIVGERIRAYARECAIREVDRV